MGKKIHVYIFCCYVVWYRVKITRKWQCSRNNTNSSLGSFFFLMGSQEKNADVLCLDAVRPKEPRTICGVSSEYFLYCCSPTNRNLATLKKLPAIVRDIFCELLRRVETFFLPAHQIVQICYLFPLWERALPSCDSGLHSTTILKSASNF